jgi:hypothetical protein
MENLHNDSSTADTQAKLSSKMRKWYEIRASPRYALALHAGVLHAFVCMLCDPVART